jgi:hypothetical protein
MKNNPIFKIAIVIATFFVFSINVNAKKNNELYAFVCCTNLNDSVVYISTVEKLTIDLNSQNDDTKTLLKNEFSNYIIRTYNNTIPSTTTLFVAKKQRKINKLLNKVKNVTVTELNKRIKIVSVEEFSMNTLFKKD